MTTVVSAKASPETPEQRVVDTEAAAMSRAPAKMQVARMWMGVGGSLFAAGLAWLLLAEEPSGFAWTLVVVGALRFIGGVFDLRDGRKMAAGEWKPLAGEAAARVRMWVLIACGVALLSAIALLVYGLRAGLV